MRFLVAFLSILPLAAVGEVLTKVILPTDVASKESAYCLDGSAAGYYLSEHHQTDRDHSGWVVYLQGGGLCVTEIDCKDRAKGNLGSSTHWGATHTDTNNVLANVSGNPFANYSKVWVPYCSGDTWVGQTLKNTHLGGLHTCGHNILRAVLNHLHSTTTFSSASHVLLSGGSAGGIGVYQNADYFADTVRSLSSYTPGVVVKASPQSGLFFPKNVFNFETFALGSKVPFDYFASTYLTWLEEGYRNPVCAKALGKKLQHRCWDAMVAQQYIKTPLFVAQNQFDNNQIPDELLCPPPICSEHPTSKVGKAFMIDYGAKTVKSVKSILAQHPSWGAFVPACYQHTDDMCMTEGPTIGASKTTYGQALGAWYFEKNTGVNTTLFDDCSDGLPCNTQCDGFHCTDS